MNGKFVKRFSLNDQPIRQKRWTFARAKARLNRFVAGSLKVVVAILILSASTFIVVDHAKKVFAFDGTETVYEKVIERVETPNEIPPILAKIAKCESGGTHLDKNGQVLINKTKDVGLYQINVGIHGKKASELGLDLYNERDNEAFAVYLFENYGSEPWIHSKKCWSK